MYLMENNSFLFTKLTKKTKTTKKVLGTIVNKNKIEAKTFL